MKTWGALLGTVAIAATAAWLSPFLASAGASSTPGSTACGSGAHGSAGYAYAGLESIRVGSGVRATVSQLRAPAVAAGHAAAWIGVGGPNAGPNGETMWLQVGMAALPRTPVMLYAEITRAGHDPVFLPLSQSVAVGQSHRLAVLEMNGRPGVWRVWVDGVPATDPIVLEGSHKRWKPIATAETWNAGTGACNRFGFRFDRVGVAQSLGGSWRTFEPGFTFRDRGVAVRQLSPAPAGQRTLSADGLQAYAFEALSA